MVAVAKPPARRFSPQEYLELEREAEFKSEYLDGQIYAMAGASPTHNRISANTVGETVVQLKASHCQAFGSDQKVRIPSKELFAYPDLTIVCGEPRYHDEHGDVLTNPVAIVKVLSPSTEDYDRGTKFTRYQDIETLTDYVLIYQDQPRVDHYRRQSRDQWLLTTIAGLDAELRIDSVGCLLRLQDIYNRVVFTKHKEGEAAS